MTQTPKVEVQLRERLSKDQSQVLVEYMSGPKIRMQYASSFDAQMQIHFAHCLMLMQQGIIPAEDGAAILAELLMLYEEGSDAIPLDYTLEDLFSHIERYLVKNLGADVAGRLHTARSRNDMGFTTARLVLRDGLLQVQESLLRLQAVVLEQAERYAEVVMPGYTAAQQAQPMTLGYYLAAFADAMARDSRRIEAAFATNNCNPLGAAALATTGFMIDRVATTESLGFDALIENGLDAVSSRDDLMEAASAIAILGVTVGRVAEDFYVWHTKEFGFIEFSDDFANVSSIMPQKKNPSLLKHIKKEIGHLISVPNYVMSGMKGSWFMDTNYFTDGGDPVQDACNTIVGCLELLAGGLGSMEVKSDRMLHFARTGYSTMTEVADTIVREAGVSFRIAHNIVGNTVVQALSEGLDSDALTPQMFEQSSIELFGRPLNVSEGAIQRALDPVENVRQRTVRGGTAPEEIARMIQDRRRVLDDSRLRVETARQSLKGARERLLDDAHKAVQLHS